MGFSNLGIGNRHYPFSSVFTPNSFRWFFPKFLWCIYLLISTTLNAQMEYSAESQILVFVPFSPLWCSSLLHRSPCSHHTISLFSSTQGLCLALPSLQLARKLSQRNVVYPKSFRICFRSFRGYCSSLLGVQCHGYHSFIFGCFNFKLSDKSHH